MRHRQSSAQISLRLRRLGGGLRSWLAVRWIRTAAHRPPGLHSLRSRHSRAAASAPASLPSLTVPQRYASVGRLAGRGASTLSVHGLCGNGTLKAGLTAPPSCGGSAGPSRGVCLPSMARTARTEGAAEGGPRAASSHNRGTGAGHAFLATESLAVGYGRPKAGEGTLGHVCWTKPGSRGGSQARSPLRRSTLRAWRLVSPGEGLT